MSSPKEPARDAQSLHHVRLRENDNCGAAHTYGRRGNDRYLEIGVLAPGHHSSNEPAARRISRDAFSAIRSTRSSVQIRPWQSWRRKVVENIPVLLAVGRRRERIAFMFSKL